MQAVDNILIQKVDNYIKNKEVLVEVEALNFSQKLKMTYDDFHLPLSILRESFVCQKIFSFFSVLIIRDKKNKMIGFKLILDNNDTYQFAFFNRKDKDGNITKVEEYAIINQDLDLILEIEKFANNIENSFIIKSNKYNNNLSNIILKEKACAIIMQKIENLMGENDIKIYQIRRKESPVLKYKHNLDNIISFKR